MSKYEQNNHISLSWNQIKVGNLQLWNPFGWFSSMRDSRCRSVFRLLMTSMRPRVNLYCCSNLETAIFLLNIHQNKIVMYTLHLGCTASQRKTGLINLFQGCSNSIKRPLVLQQSSVVRYDRPLRSKGKMLFKYVSYLLLNIWSWTDSSFIIHSCW